MSIPRKKKSITRTVCRTIILLCMIGIRHLYREINGFEKVTHEENHAEAVAAPQGRTGQSDGPLQVPVGRFVRGRARYEFVSIRVRRQARAMKNRYTMRDWSAELLLVRWVMTIGPGHHATSNRREKKKQKSDRQTREQCVPQPAR